MWLFRALIRCWAAWFAACTSAGWEVAGCGRLARNVLSTGPYQASACWAAQVLACRSAAVW